MRHIIRHAELGHIVTVSTDGGKQLAHRLNQVKLLGMLL